MAFGVTCLRVVALTCGYVPGRLLARRPVVLLVVWVLGTLPFAHCLFFAWLTTLGYVACPAGAYQCPL
jgi:hypothetical protein